VLSFLGIELNVKSAASWAGTVVVALIGLGLFELTRKRFALRWGEVQGEIEAAIRAREAA